MGLTKTQTQLKKCSFLSFFDDRNLVFVSYANLPFSTKFVHELGYSFFDEDNIANGKVSCSKLFLQINTTKDHITVISPQRHRKCLIWPSAYWLDSVFASKNNFSFCFFGYRRFLLFLVYWAFIEN